MGHRLSKIVTRTGDDGTTGLGDGARVAKDAPRIAALGDLDELNSALGCVLADAVPEPVRAALAAAQNDLFDLGGEVSIPGRVAMTPTHVARLDAAIAELNAGLPPLKEFILPGGDRAAAACHLARAICRRAERSLVALRREAGASEESLQYLNRLSDLLFVAARVINRARARHEALWQPGGSLKAHD
jgi:cob(I)alamin adenosyltransferase